MKRERESISYFDRISAKARYTPLSPLVSGKKQSDVQARETKLTLAISNRAIVRASPVAKSLAFSGPLLLLLLLLLHVAFQCTSREPGCMQQYPSSLPSLPLPL